MRKQKDRLTVTIDRVLLQAANDAVAAGRAPSLSSWVNRALAERVQAAERKLVVGVLARLASGELELPDPP